MVSMHIRRGRMSRQQGLDIVRKAEGLFPSSYLDKSIEDILGPLEISVGRFEQLCDEYTNLALFEKSPDGSLKKDSAGNLVKVNYDNEDTLV